MFTLLLPRLEEAIDLGRAQTNNFGYLIRLSKEDDADGNGTRSSLLGNPGVGYGE